MGQAPKEKRIAADIVPASNEELLGDIVIESCAMISAPA